MKNQIDLAVNAALSQYELSNLRQRIGFGGASIDAKRPKAWCEYGFPAEITYDMLYRLWRRGGVAFGAVKKIIGNSWRTAPEIIQGDDESDNVTAWEREIAKAMPGFFDAFKEADRRRLVGRFSAIILRVADGRSFMEPVKPNSKIVEFIPVWAGALSVSKTDDDPNSETYGEPLMWQYVDRYEKQNAIHKDRIFILGDSSCDGVGFLEPAYNSFITLEKIEGGTGESFLKNASRQLNIDFDKEIDLKDVAAMYGVELDQLKTQFQKAARDLNVGNDVLLTTQGATVNSLVSTIANPKDPYNIVIQSIAAALDIPTKILVGQQTGERASTEDNRYFNNVCTDHRNDLSKEMIELINKCMALRIVPSIEEFSIFWDDLNESTDDQKLDNAAKMADINNKAFDQSEMPFSKNEIRAAAGYDPEAEAPPLPDDENGDDDAKA